MCDFSEEKLTWENISRDAIKPRRSWKTYEKKQMIGSGIVLIVFGLAATILTILLMLEIL